jgi:hypothetical protein
MSWKKNICTRILLSIYCLYLLRIISIKIVVFLNQIKEIKGQNKERYWKLCSILP